MAVSTLPDLRSIPDLNNSSDPEQTTRHKHEGRRLWGRLKRRASIAEGSSSCFQRCGSERIGARWSLNHEKIAELTLPNTGSETKENSIAIWFPGDRTRRYATGDC